MTTYYLCDTKIAQRYCNGLSYVEVYVSPNNGLIFLSLEQKSRIWADGNTILLKDISSEMHTILKLSDKSFRVINSDFWFAFDPVSYRWKVL